MKLRTFIYMLLSLAVLQGCFDDSYRGAADDPQTNPLDRIPVVVRVGDPSSAQAASLKGSGAVSGMSDWEGRTIYVYAFNRYLQTDFATTSSRDDVQCLVDGSIDEEGSLAGKQAIVSAAGTTYWAGTQIWYPVGEQETQQYDFFAYHTGCGTLPPSKYHRSIDKISIDVEIDGSQDLMTAKAELRPEDLAKFPADEQERITEYAYSYYTGAKGILPEFYFTHHLTKIDFEILPGYVANATKRIYVESVSVVSKYKTRFAVADKSTPSQLGVTFVSNERKELFLSDTDGSPLRAEKYGVETLSYEQQNKTPVHVGGSLLVSPGDTEMTAYVTLKELRYDGTVVELDGLNEISLALEDGVYEPGAKYLVRLTLYGALNIDTTIEMMKWEEAGDIIIDTEEKME